MIEVEVFAFDGRSDVAEADSPEAALLAARTLGREVPVRVQGYDPVVTFRVDGEVVRRTTYRAIL